MSNVNTVCLDGCMACPILEGREGGSMTVHWGSSCAYFGSEILGTCDYLGSEIFEPPNVPFGGLKFRVVEIIWGLIFL